jgi:YVTN family beta-propeller protein
VVLLTLSVAGDKISPISAGNACPNRREPYDETRSSVSGLASVVLAFMISSCAPAEESKPVANEPPPRPAGSYHVYITNERSGDLTIIDSVTNDVVATVPLGKRPRGIHVSPDKKTIYVALSGSPIAVLEWTNPSSSPADKTADGIGVFDIAERNS